MTALARRSHFVLDALYAVFYGLAQLTATRRSEQESGSDSDANACSETEHIPQRMVRRRNDGATTVHKVSAEALFEAARERPPTSVLARLEGSFM